MAFSVTSIDIDEVLEHGGYPFVLTGSFEANHSYYVYIGINGTTADPKAHSGIAGQGAEIFPYNLTTIKGYTPIMPPGVVCNVLVEDVVTLATDILANSITARTRYYGSKIFNIRKLLVRLFKTGARDIGTVE